MRKAFAIALLLGMVGGTLTGWFCHEHWTDAASRATAAAPFTFITEVFLRLIKMIIAPLVLVTLVTGVARLDDAKAIGRIGLKAMAWFMAASVLSLVIGLLGAQWLRPGAGIDLALARHDTTADPAASFSGRELLIHAVPTSIADALARNDILQVVVFALFFGVALASLKARASAVSILLEQLGTSMLKVTGYVMTLAPLAVFAALAATVTTQGPEVLGAYLKFVGGFYLLLLVLWVLLLLAAQAVAGYPPRRLLAAVAEPVLIAFSTASSEAAYPSLLEALQKSGVPKRIASFILPLGYSFNLDGAMLYCSFATLFVAQAYGIELSMSQQFMLLSIMLLTSKGMAGVPRAALIVVTAAFSALKIPAEGAMLILAVDHILDMGRSATNAIGNSVAAVVLAKWERGFVTVAPSSPAEEPIEPVALPEESRR